MKLEAYLRGFFFFSNFDPSEQIVAHRIQKWIKETETKTGEGADFILLGRQKTHSQLSPEPTCTVVEAVRNVMAHGDAWEGK